MNQETTGKHTKTPWTHHKGSPSPDGHKAFDIHRVTENCDCAEWIGTIHSTQSGEAAAKANAQFIVTACNNFEELVAMLEKVVNNFITQNSYPEYEPKKENNRFIDLASIETSARSLLSKIKGTK